MYNPGDAISETFVDSTHTWWIDTYKFTGGKWTLIDLDSGSTGMGFWYQGLYNNPNHDTTGLVASLDSSDSLINEAIIHPQSYHDPDPGDPPYQEGDLDGYWAFSESVVITAHNISGTVPPDLAPGTYYLKGRRGDDSWLIRSLNVVLGLPITPPLPDRPDDYDPDLGWDEQLWDWIPVVAGGGRYKQQIVAIGELGEIYFGDV